MKFANIKKNFEMCIVFGLSPANFDGAIQQQ